MAKKGNVFTRLLSKIDKFQQRNRFFGFAYAVIKKNGDDDAGNLAALITYYGFLSLFPLLLVATTVTQLVLKNNPGLKDEVSESIGKYLPEVGDQLQQQIHSTGKVGLGLVVGILLTIYGARGGANALIYALNHIWRVPRVHRAGFPKSTIKSLVILLGGGIGLLVAATISNYATAGAGHVFYLQLLPLLASLAIITGVFFSIFKYAIDTKGPDKKDVLISAVVAAIGVQLLQSLGSYLVIHQLSRLGSLYGTFAIVLGLLFWIYLQAQVVLLAVEVGSVHAMKLWPRSLRPDAGLTEADKKAYALLAKKERFLPPEKVRVKFKD